MTAEVAPRVFDPRRCYIGFAQEGTHIMAQDGNFYDEAGGLVSDAEVPAWVRAEIRRMGGLRPLAQGASRRVYACPLCDLELANGRELMDHLRDEHRAVLPTRAAAPASAAPVAAEQDPDRRVEEYDGSDEFPAQEEGEGAADSQEEGDGEPRAAKGAGRGRSRPQRRPR